MDFTIQRIEPDHPLTEKFVHLVVEGSTPFQAVMALVGEHLTREEAPYQLERWERDKDVQHRINQEMIRVQKLHTNIRARVASRLLAMAFSDVRNYFTAEGPKPIPTWTQEESHAVKKIKFSETTDPFGNVTKNMELEFHDVYKSLSALAALFPEKLADIIKTDGHSRRKLREMSAEELENLHKELLAG